MALKTSVNIKPCNIGSSEAHNRRTAEYLANIRKEKFYIRTDLMAGNRPGDADQRPGKGEQEDRKGDHSPWQHSAQGGRGCHQGRHNDGAVTEVL